MAIADDLSFEYTKGRVPWSENDEGHTTEELIFAWLDTATKKKIAGIKKARREFANGIKEFNSYRIFWHTNIVETVKNSFSNYKAKQKISYINNNDLHIIANEVATNFLKLLTK